MKTIITTLTIILLSISTVSYGQFVNLKNKMKKAVKKENNKAGASGKTPEAKTAILTTANLSAETKTTESLSPDDQLTPLAFDAPFEPAIWYRSLLNGIKINHRNGLLMIGSNMTVSFLPEKEEGGTLAFYGPKPEQHKLAVHLTREGATLKKYLTTVMQRLNGTLRSSTKGPFADFSITTNGYAEQQGYDTEKHTFTEAGDYALEFFLDGKRFYEFPFQVKDGKIVPQGNQVRGDTPPKSFVEGGREHFWIFRQGSPLNK